jgi:transposase InsO family protein
MDWSTRKVLSWRVSNTMEVDFCIEALEEAMDRHCHVNRVWRPDWRPTRLTV